MLEKWYFDRITEINMLVERRISSAIRLFIYLFYFEEAEYKLPTDIGVCIGQVNVITADCIRKHGNMSQFPPIAPIKIQFKKRKQFEALTFSISDSINVIFFPRLMRYSGGK